MTRQVLPFPGRSIGLALQWTSIGNRNPRAIAGALGWLLLARLARTVFGWTVLRRRVEPHGHLVLHAVGFARLDTLGELPAQQVAVVVALDELDAGSVLGQRGRALNVLGVVRHRLIDFGRPGVVVVGVVV